MINWYNVTQNHPWLSKELIFTIPDLVRVLKEDENAGFIFWGGSDIGASLYQEESVHPFTPTHRSLRDQFEQHCVRLIREKQRPMVGICRGAQLLNVLFGGKLWQDVDNHSGNVFHDLEIIYNGTDVAIEDTISANSEHHQMMIPGKDATIIGYTSGVSTYRVSEQGKVDSAYTEPEIVGYKDKKVLCIQGHPEWIPDSEYNMVCQTIIGDYFK